MAGYQSGCCEVPRSAARASACAGVICVSSFSNSAIERSSSGIARCRSRPAPAAPGPLPPARACVRVAALGSGLVVAMHLLLPRERAARIAGQAQHACRGNASRARSALRALAAAPPSARRGFDFATRFVEPAEITQRHRAAGARQQRELALRRRLRFSQQRNHRIEIRQGTGEVAPRQPRLRRARSAWPRTSATHAAPAARESAAPPSASSFGALEFAVIDAIRHQVLDEDARPARCHRR